MNDDFVRSPCVSVCALNEDSVCMGCYRTSEEIKQWSLFSSDERRAVIAQTKERFESSTKHFLV